MKYSHPHRITGFVLGLTAATLATSLSPSLAAAASEHKAAPASAPHAHGVMQPVRRLQPKRVVTVTGNEDWDSLRGFGKDAAMAEMMTLMMVGGSGMEHMKMGPMKKRGTQVAAMNSGDMAQGASEATGQPQGVPMAVTVTPNPPIVGDNTLDIAVTDASGKPATGLKLTASVAMTNMDMGTEHPKVVERRVGHYSAVVNFSMKGPWRVTLTSSATDAHRPSAARTALDFNVGSDQRWGQPTGPKVALDTPPDTLKAGKNTLTFTVLDAAGKPVTGAKVTTAVAMTNMNMGTTHPPARETNGHYTTEVEFSMKGPWRVTLTITPPNRKPFTHAFEFDVQK
jgi:hypothetical protein